tara:strand:- start:105 stop:314 length:210 start_codon:yes stop_codon:yes gene_type:complete
MTIDFERTPMEHYAFMYLSTNFPGSEDNMVFTLVSDSECVIEYGDNHREIIKFTDGLDTAEIIPYPYPN